MGVKINKKVVLSWIVVLIMILTGCSTGSKVGEDNQKQDIKEIKYYYEKTELVTDSKDMSDIHGIRMSENFAFFLMEERIGEDEIYREKNILYRYDLQNPNQSPEKLFTINTNYVVDFCVWEQGKEGSITILYCIDETYCIAEYDCDGNIKKEISIQHPPMKEGFSLFGINCVGEDEYFSYNNEEFYIIDSEGNLRSKVVGEQIENIAQVELEKDGLGLITYVDSNHQTAVGEIDAEQFSIVESTNTGELKK